MKNLQIFPLILSVCFLITDSNFVIKGAVKKRNTIIKINDNFPAKRRRENGRARGVFKIYIRRVLKGDIGKFGDLLNFETRTKNSSNRAFLYAEGGPWKRGCSSSGGWAALLFGKGYSSPLKLVIDPIPSNLEHVRRVKAVIQGK
ncbi:hypothetical protein ACJJTC_008023 [Scirpophaga incertulas]